KIRGVTLDKGGAVFKGVPYADAPLGDLRWKPPAPVKTWNGVRDATAFGSPCAQNSGGRMLENSKEDCLFLNVWSPEWPAKSRRPVMFWIHGGGNFGGSSSNPGFDGESLARRGVVVVSANYRLTLFGFFAHPELTRESAHRASGNYGLMDQIAALKWVRDNIAKFGGDPANVTIFGQSAGAVDANVLMTSPLAKGLFHKVIAESGTVTRNPDAGTMGMTALAPSMAVKAGPVTYSDAAGLSEAEKKGIEIAARLNAPTDGALNFLRNVPAPEILKIAAMPQMAIGPANGVIVDGWVFPKSPAEVFASGQHQHLPLLIGNNSRERTPPRTSAEDLTKAMQAMYGPLAQGTVSLYNVNGNSPADPLYGETATQWVVDTMYRCPVVAQLIWHAGAGNVGYEYQFDRAAPGREPAGAVHGAEVPYVFGALSAGRGGSAYADIDHELSSAIQQYWTNFAKTANPNGGDLPQWPRFDAAARGYIEFTDNGPIAREGLRRPFCDLYVENVKRLRAQ
ncbi:MAG: carboxylesterase family protein, partial [Solirubrobacterales bacterium]|nr:carboxylesterase family protein [Solirubrobacterales bacterium]